MRVVRHEEVALLHPHLPHPHVHPGFDEHPWRMLPVSLGTLVVLTAVLVAVCFDGSGTIRMYGLGSSQEPNFSLA